MRYSQVNTGPAERPKSWDQEIQVRTMGGGPFIVHRFRSVPLWNAIQTMTWCHAEEGVGINWLFPRILRPQLPTTASVIAHPALALCLHLRPRASLIPPCTTHINPPPNTTTQWTHSHPAPRSWPTRLMPSTAPQSNRPANPAVAATCPSSTLTRSPLATIRRTASSHELP
jgi:hypothetical protein